MQIGSQGQTGAASYGMRPRDFRLPLPGDGQCFLQVGKDIGSFLNADRQPDQAVAYADLRTLLRCECAMG